MQADLERLIDLQQADLRLRELNTLIRVFPRLRQETEQKLETARQTLQSARDAKTHNATERKKIELDVLQFAGKIDKFKGQMLEVKTNDAYRALQHEIAHFEKEKATAEDRELEAMVGADDFDGKIKDAEVEVKTAEQTINAELQRIDAEQKIREDEAAQLSAHREELCSGISEESLDEYQRLAAAKHGRALAEARDEICQACMTQLRPQIFMEVRNREKLHTCGTCHRILYFAGPPAAGVETEMARGNQA